MQDWRFDELTKNLGRATSRRQVFKGVLGGLAAALVGRGLHSAEAAGGSCSTTQYRECLATAKDQYDVLMSNCGTTDGPPASGSFCAFTATAWYARAVRQCQTAQCPAGMSCVNDHCCRGQDCCGADQHYCPGGGFNGEGGTCCADGSSCCAGGCCTPDKTCCINIEGGFFSPSASQVCTDLQTDPKNCGACRNKCNSIPCIDGTCQCPAGDSICKGPFNQTCCHPNEHCQANLLGFVQCDPRCDDCETYNQTTGTCDPIECGVCSTCVSGTCQPVDDGTECGSGLVCQQGRCVAACPQECTVYQNGQCVAAPNGTSCGGGSSTCCNGTCSGIPGQACCSDAGSSCGPSLCCDPDTYCNQTCNNQYVCCVGDVLPDGTCCQADETPLRCGYADGSTKDVCCGAAANGYNECHCCGDECCTTNNCGPSGPVEC